MKEDAARPIASGGSPDLPPVRSEHSGAFVRLSRLWQHRSHFSLIFAAVDNPAYRDALIARLAALGGATRVDLHEGDAASAWLGAAQQAQVAGTTRLHLCLPLDKPRLDTWWQQANLLRERLADALPGVQVLWVSDTDADRAAHEAPDLWNWREVVLSFTAQGVPGLPSVPGTRFDGTTGVEADALAERAAAIEQYLAAGHGDDLASAYLRLEAARAYLRLGQWKPGLEHARLAVRTYAAHGHESGASGARAVVAGFLRMSGQPDQALSMLTDEVLPVFQSLGDIHSRAVTLGQIADILRDRGEIDEALRIRREEELPVYERLGDVRSKAVTLGQIADILQDRGQIEEALRIHLEEELPIFERLGDIRSRTVTLGRIADILRARGRIDEALRIHQEEELPVYERLGDVHARAITLGRVADILQARGQFEEALHIRREEELPVYERLGDVRAKAVALGRIADILQARGQIDEALRIRQEEQLPVYERLGDVRSKAVALGRIADILQARGQFEEALRIHREEELPVYERLGDARSKAVTIFRIAEILQTRGQLDEARRHAADAREIFARLDPTGIAHCDDLLGRIRAAGRGDRG